MPTVNSTATRDKGAPKADHIELMKWAGRNTSLYRIALFGYTRDSKESARAFFTVNDLLKIQQAINAVLPEAVNELKD